MPVQISGMTLAATNMEAMVAFYNTVLDTDFQPVELFPGATGYRGTLAGMNVLMCPNSVARVDARQNRQQFDFWVDDVLATVAAALAHSGREVSPIYEQNGILIGSVYDPDGNSMVFKQNI